VLQEPPSQQLAPEAQQLAALSMLHDFAFCFVWSLAAYTMPVRERIRAAVMSLILFIYRIS
jgi:hypothetical protein